MTKSFPHITVERQFISEINQFSLVISEINDEHIDRSNHQLRELLLDWLAHWSLNKECCLLDICNYFCDYLELGKTTCMLCSFANTGTWNPNCKGVFSSKIQKTLYAFLSKLSNKHERHKAVKNGFFRVHDPPQKMVLVDLEQYQPQGFVWGRKKNEKLKSLTEDDLFDFSVLKEFLGDLVEPEASKREAFFELEVGGIKERLNTTDFDEAMEQATFIKVASIGKVILWHHCGGNKEAHIL